MQIDIKNTKHLSDLSEFEPVEGKWFRDKNDGLEVQFTDVISAIKTILQSEHEIIVGVFHADGRLICGDLPSEGQWVATRSF